MKAYFEGCKGSILKKQVIDFYYNEVKIEEANTEYYEVNLNGQA